MSKNDIVTVETDFSEEAGGGFRLHQCGFLSDMRRWQFPGLRGPFWRCYHHVGAGSFLREGGRRVPLLPGEVVLIPEDVVFDARGAAGVAHHWLHFSPPVGVRTRPDTRVVRLPVDPPLAGLLREWRPLLRGGAAAPEARRRLLHASLAVLHACLARARLPETAAEAGGELRAVLEEIERSLAAPAGNAALARRAGRSVEGFIRWFKEETGTTPARYGTRRRVQEAGRLLTLTGRSIDEVAAAVGFANRHHFSRVFARHTGHSPARFRAAQRQVG